MKIYETERLLLREWKDSDTDPFIKLNQDPHVLRYFPAIYSKEQTLDSIVCFRQHFSKYGYTIYACELKSSSAFIGFVGLYHRSDMPFSPCVEIAWRLNKDYWGQGYAAEAAQKCLEIGFIEFALPEIVAFTAKINRPSERVMQKIGMTYNSNDDFLHYKLDKSHILAPQILYRIKLSQYLEQQKGKFSC